MKTLTVFFREIFSGKRQPREVEHTDVEESMGLDTVYANINYDIAIGEDIDLLEEAKVFVSYKQPEKAACVLLQYVKIHPEAIDSFAQLLNIYLDLEQKTEFFDALKLFVQTHSEHAQVEQFLAAGIAQFPNHVGLNGLAKKLQLSQNTAPPVATVADPTASSGG